MHLLFPLRLAFLYNLSRFRMCRFKDFVIQGKETLVGDILEGACLSTAFSRVFLKTLMSVLIYSKAQINDIPQNISLPGSCTLSFLPKTSRCFVMGSFQFRFVVTATVLLLVLVHALCFFAFAKTNRLLFLVRCFQ